MFTNASVPSLSDIAAVSGRNNNNDGFGGNNGWWVLVILFALFGGWGRGGYGYGGGQGGGAADNYVLASDFANLSRQIDSSTAGLERKLDGINNGICSLGYDQLAQINNVNSNINQTGYEIMNGMNQNAIASMQQTNALQAQLANCCCENREAICQLKYDISQNLCNLRFENQQAIQAIIQNDNANYRALHDENVALQMANKDETIAELRSRLNFRDINDSNAQQSAYLLSQLGYGFRKCGCNPCGGCNNY